MTVKAKMSKTKKIILGIAAVIIFTTLLVLPTVTIAARASTTYGANWYLKVFEPTPYEIVTGPYLALHVQSINYQLDSRYAGTPSLPTIGHYHEILDGNLIDMTPTTDPTHDLISMVGVTDGLHVLTLVPALNDHSMVMANAIMIPFYYEGPYLPEPTYTGSPSAPTVSIASPINGATVSGNSFQMSIHFQNFLLCGGCYGKALQSNVGHWHIFLDQIAMPHMLTMANANVQQVYLTGVSPGWHTFFAVLVQNNHMPIMDMTTGMPLAGTFTMVDLYVTNTQ